MILRLDSVHLARDGNHILRGISLEVAPGEFFVLMGPTGCGKTTTLRISGLLERPDSGGVFFRGKEARWREKDLLPLRRRMATVFQGPVMFSGTVFANIAWGLRIRGVPREEIHGRVGEMVEMTGLKGLEGRDAKTLSGGEVRRVALARAMVLRPELLFLDEPTASLHRSFRRTLLERLKTLHRETGTTFFMATHSFEDALALGTSAAVMRAGEIEQTGTMNSIVSSPGSTFMAEFTGAGNILPVVFKGATALAGETEIVLPASRHGQGCISIPPEAIVLALNPSRTSERNHLTGIVAGIRRNGVNWTVTVDVSGTLLDSSVTTGALDDLEIHQGSPVCLSFKASAVHIF